MFLIFTTNQAPSVQKNLISKVINCPLIVFSVPWKVAIKSKVSNPSRFHMPAGISHNILTTVNVMLFVPNFYEKYANIIKKYLYSDTNIF